MGAAMRPPGPPPAVNQEANKSRDQNHPSHAPNNNSGDSASAQTWGVSNRNNLGRGPRLVEGDALGRILEGSFREIVGQGLEGTSRGAGDERLDRGRERGGSSVR